MPSVSLLSEIILFPALLIRSLPISHIFLYPALYVSEFLSTSSGNWTEINLLFPPSFKLLEKTECAVVHDPEKKYYDFSFCVTIMN